MDLSDEEEAGRLTVRMVLILILCVFVFLQAVLKMTASCSGPGCSPRTSWRSGLLDRTTCCSTSAGNSPTSAQTTARAKR